MPGVKSGVGIGGRGGVYGDLWGFMGIYGGRIGFLMDLWGSDRVFDGFPRGTLGKWGVGGGIE